MKIEVKQLSLFYDGICPVFERLDWQVVSGQKWAIIGPSGCGKSTLLYLLAGLIRPSSGSISIDNDEILRPRPKTGLVLQDHGLLPWATVRKNVRLGMTIREFYGPDNRHAPVEGVMEKSGVDERVDYWLERLGIKELGDKYPGHLSRGQRQRTALARTLVLQPDLLLLDEPFSALDAPTKKDLRMLMETLCRESDLTRIIVTHDIEEAVIMGEHILVLGGKKNRTPLVFENIHAAEPEEVNYQNFRTQCDRLRGMLEAVE